MNYIRIIHPYIRKTQVILTYAFYLSLISRRPVPSFCHSVIPAAGVIVAPPYCRSGGRRCRHTPLCHSEERSDAGISFSIMQCYHNMRLPRLLAKPRNDSAEYAITMPPHPHSVIPRSGYYHSATYCHSEERSDAEISFFPLKTTFCFSP